MPLYYDPIDDHDLTNPRFELYDTYAQLMAIIIFGGVFALCCVGGIACTACCVSQVNAGMGMGGAVGGVGYATNNSYAYNNNSVVVNNVQQSYPQQGVVQPQYAQQGVIQPSYPQQGVVQPQYA